eukprot:2146781-Prorocentrum_lima.AAC.1
MTSSLVGSEMCIRDSLRDNVPRKNAKAPFTPCTSVGRQCSTIRRSAILTRCLLYTSDAADDM